MTPHVGRKYSPEAQASNTPLFQSVLGDTFFDLPIEVQDFHRSELPSRWVGEASVTRGTSLLSKLVGWAFRFPPAAKTVSVTVVKETDGTRQKWTREFGRAEFHSILNSTAEGMTEQFWPFTFQLDLGVRDGGLCYPVKAGRLGPFPMPKWLLPVSNAREFAQDGCFHFDVELRAPITGWLLVHYQGWLERSGG